MKRLLVLMSAVVTAMGLSAAQADSSENKYATSFESGDPGIEGSTFNVSAAAGWSYGTDDVENPQITDHTGDLPYGKTLTGAPVEKLNRRDAEFYTQDANNKYLNLETGTHTLARKIANGQIFVDQLVKFTGFEEMQESFEEGTKIAVWMSAIETEGNEGDSDFVAGETNLYVAVGTESEKRNVKLNFTPVPEKWYRLTIKSIGNAISGEDIPARAGFKIFIDGMPVSIVDEDKTYADAYKAYFNGDVAELYSNGQLFLSRVSGETTLVAVGYKGIGGLDDLIISENAPDFAYEAPSVATLKIKVPTGAILTITDDKGSTYELSKDGTVTVSVGAKLTLTFVADEDYLMSSVTKEITVTGDETIITEDVVPQEVLLGLAWDGGTKNEKYANLVRALEKIKTLNDEGEVVEMDVAKSISPIKTAEGMLGFKKGSFTTINEDGSWDGGDIVISGTLSHSWKVQSVTIIEGEKLTLAKSGKLITTEKALPLSAVEGYKISRSEADEDGYYTYTAISDDGGDEPSGELTSWDDVTDETTLDQLPDGLLSTDDKSALKKAGVTAKKISDWANGSGSVEFNDGALINLDAYLLNVVNTVEAVETAKAKFKIPSISIENGTVTVKNPEGTFNGTVTIKGSATVNGEYNLDATDAAARFFKAILSL